MHVTAGGLVFHDLRALVGVASAYGVSVYTRIQYTVTAVVLQTHLYSSSMGGQPENASKCRDGKDKSACFVPHSTSYILRMHVYNSRASSTRGMALSVAPRGRHPLSLSITFRAGYVQYEGFTSHKSSVPLPQLPINLGLHFISCSPASYHPDSVPFDFRYGI
jgi:hypothetical protein